VRVRKSESTTEGTLAGADRLERTKGKHLEQETWTHQNDPYEQLTHTWEKGSGKRWAARKIAGGERGKKKPGER